MNHKAMIGDHRLTLWHLEELLARLVEMPLEVWTDVIREDCLWRFTHDQRLGLARIVSLDWESAQVLAEFTRIAGLEVPESKPWARIMFVNILSMAAEENMVVTIQQAFEALAKAIRKDRRKRTHVANLSDVDTRLYSLLSREQRAMMNHMRLDKYRDPETMKRFEACVGFENRYREDGVTVVEQLCYVINIK